MGDLFSYSETIVGCLAFISAFLGVIIKMQHDKILSIKNQISEKKYHVYNEVFSILFDIIRQDKGFSKVNDPNDLADRIIQIKKDLLIYGTDEIIKKFTEWNVNCSKPEFFNIASYVFQKFFFLCRICCSIHVFLRNKANTKQLFCQRTISIIF